MDIERLVSDLASIITICAALISTIQFIKRYKLKKVILSLGMLLLWVIPVLAWIGYMIYWFIPNTGWEKCLIIVTAFFIINKIMKKIESYLQKFVLGIVGWVGLSMGVIGLLTGVVFLLSPLFRFTIPLYVFMIGGGQLFFALILLFVWLDE